MRRSRHDDFDDTDALSVDDFSRPLRPKMRRRAMSVGRLLVGITASAGFATLIAYPRGHAAVTAPPAAAATPKWVDAAATDELFKLQVPALEGLARTYSVNRKASGLGREDIMTIGLPGSNRGYVRLEIRQAMQSGPDAGLFVALVRRAAEAGLAITRAGQSFVLPTRLGPFDASDVTLVAAESQELACLGLRLRSTDTRLQITGLACGETGKRPAPATLACMLDALAMTPESHDPSLRSFFQEAERRRGSLCRQAAPKGGLSFADLAAETPAAAATATRKTSRRTTGRADHNDEAVY